MKKLLAIALCSLLSLNLSAQDYLPLLTDGRYWDITFMDIGYICTGFGEYTYRYVMDGEITLGDQTYSQFKRYKLYNQEGMNLPSCPPFYADTLALEVFDLFLREDLDAQQVFAYAPGSGQDLLLFDFSLEQGDTLYTDLLQSGSLPIDTIYTIVTGDGVERRVFESTAGGPGQDGRYIEGIGGYGGLFSASVPFEAGPRLFCAGLLDGTYLWSPDPFTTACADFISGNADLPALDAEVLVQPTLFKNDVFIESKQSVLLVLYDQSGRPVYQQQKPEARITLDLSHFSSGIYFLKLKDEQGRIATKRLVKTN
ncbi:MAG: T9SS type A sorting domain-containing protein [Phaeodactylibacter sp.]|nr:T9SS type A sorting domain-containing protein [Phaeodactylibacter sp.]